VQGYSQIDVARSELGTRAFLDGFDEILWIDSDVGFSSEDVDQLRSHELPVVCAIYPKKNRRALACHLGFENEQLTFGRGGAVVEIRYAATGFLLTHRSVYATMIDELELPVCNTQFDTPLIPFFMPLVVTDGNGKPWYLGEDFAFCERARQVGYSIMADTTIRLYHYGTYGFSWEDAGEKRTLFDTYHYHVPPSN